MEDFDIFKLFVETKYSLHLDDIISKIKKNKADPYRLLTEYTQYLGRKRNISTLTIKQRVVTVKNFLEYHDINIIQEDSN